MWKKIIWVLPFVCFSAQASDWVSIPLRNPNKVVMMDATSVSISGSVRRAWLKFVMPPHSTKGVGVYEGRFVSYVLMRTAFDCEQRNSRTDGAQWSYEDGTNSTTTPASLAEWTPVAPDSMADALLGYVCAWKPT